MATKGKVIFRMIRGRLVPIFKKDNLIKPMTSLGKRAEGVKNLRDMARSTKVPSKAKMFKTEARKEGLKIKDVIGRILKEKRGKR